MEEAGFSDYYYAWGEEITFKEQCSFHDYLLKGNPDMWTFLS